MVPSRPPRSAASCRHQQQDPRNEPIVSGRIGPATAAVAACGWCVPSMHHTGQQQGHRCRHLPSGRCCNYPERQLLVVQQHSSQKGLQLDLSIWAAAAAAQPCMRVSHPRTSCGLVVRTRAPPPSFSDSTIPSPHPSPWCDNTHMQPVVRASPPPSCVIRVRLAAGPHLWDTRLPITFFTLLLLLLLLLLLMGAV
jgi:hypothetical protein